MINANASITYYLNAIIDVIETETGLTIPFLLNAQPEVYPSICMTELTEANEGFGRLQSYDTWALNVYTNCNDRNTNRVIRKKLLQNMGLSNNTNEKRVWIDKLNYEQSTTSPPRVGAIEIRPFSSAGWRRIAGTDPEEIRYSYDFASYYRLDAN